MNKYASLYKIPSSFKKPSSFIVGLSRALDLGSTINKHKAPKCGNKADYKAISSDWENVGNDIRRAIDGFEKSRNK